MLERNPGLSQDRKNAVSRQGAKFAKERNKSRSISFEDLKTAFKHQRTDYKVRNCPVFDWPE